MPEGYNGDPGLPPIPASQDFIGALFSPEAAARAKAHKEALSAKNLPEEEAAVLAAHRLAVRERELSAVAPCACGLSPEDGLKDMIDIIERNGIGPLLRGIILKRMENADLVVLRRVR